MTAEPLVVPLHDISIAVCRVMDVTFDQVTAYNKKISVATAREMIWYVARELTELSYPTLGECFGRDHTTVLAGVRSFKRKLNEDPVLQQRVTTVVAYLRKKERERWQTMNSARSTTSSEQRPA